MKTKAMSIDDYVARIEAHILKKYPLVPFRVLKRSEDEAVIYFLAENEAQEYPIIKRAGNIAMDALVDAGFRIHIQPN